MTEASNNNATTFTNPVMDSNTLPRFEKIALQPIHKNYWKVMCWNWIIIFSILMAGTIYISGEVNEWDLYTVIPIFIMLIIALSSIWLNKQSFLKRKYAIRHHDIVYQHGRLSTSLTIVPYARIQHVSIYESWLAKRWQLAQLKVYTTGDTTIIAGIDKDTAYSIQALILSKLDTLEQSADHQDTPNDEH